MVGFGAGVHAGLSAFPALLSVGVLAVVGGLLHRTRFGFVPWVVAAGVLIGRSTRQLDATRCASRIPPGPVAMEAQVAGSLPGDRMTVHPIGAGCRGSVTVRWRSHDPVQPGSVVRIQGRWVASPDRGGGKDGLLLAEQVHTVRPAAGTRAQSVEDRLVGQIGRLYGGRAPMVEALLLGRRGELDREVSAAFARSGLVHLLSISGFHVGVIAGWVFLLLRVIRTSRHLARVGAVILATGYVAFLGFPPPATRAAALVALLALAGTRQRRVQPEPLLAVCCLAMLVIDPWAIHQLGAWLSVSAIWGVTRFTRWSDRQLSRSWPVRTAAASIGATLATAPLTAGVLGQVAIVGIVLNFAAIPLAGLAVPGAFGSLLLTPVWPPVGKALAAGTGLALAGLERLALFGAWIPWGAVVTVPGVPAALPWLGVLTAALWVVGRRLPRRAAAQRLLLLVTGALWMTLLPGWRPDLGAAEPGLTLYHLPVGQGDATAIRTPAGRWVLVDAGPISREYDAGRQVVVPFLTRHGARRIEYLIASHAHADHIGGAGSLLERFPVGMVLDPAVPVGDSLYLALLDRTAATGAVWRPVRTGDRWELDGVRFEVLHPDTSWAGWREDLNEDSVVLLVEFGGFRAVLAGDAGAPVERLLRGRVGDVDLLKVGHHGSRGASGVAWLKELAPELAILSLGRNRYGHPAPATLRRLMTSGASVWRTDRDGTVTVWTDGQQWRASSRSRRETSQLRGPAPWRPVLP